jgi:BirA family biotin operon repressor/biotin-[acetyl-CoA-carboxylase] ligase
MFDLDRIVRSGLAAHVDHHESLGSTNDRALEVCAWPEAPLPLLVLTDQQTAGRGRGANRWWSAPGALTFSLAVSAPAEQLPAEDRPRTALVAGLAVCQALEQLAPRVQWRVKWPNDVYGDGYKVCGILCEATPTHAERLVVGIGINVNNSIAGLPTTFHGRSLFDLDGQERLLTDVLLAVLTEFRALWQRLLEGGFVSLAPEYRRRCLLTGREVAIAAGEHRTVGRCQGIDDGGALLVATEQGVRRVVAGSVEHWE